MVRARRQAVDAELAVLLDDVDVRRGVEAGALGALAEAGEDVLTDTLVALLTVGAGSLAAALPTAVAHTAARHDHWLRLAQGPDADAWAGAVVAEALRIHPPTAALSRVAVRLIDGGPGVAIADGTTLVLCPAIAQRGASWPDPGVFRPERWMDGSPVGDHLPFGVGPRRCPAAAMSDAVLVAVLRSLASRIDLAVSRPPWPSSGIVSSAPRVRAQVTWSSSA